MDRHLFKDLRKTRALANENIKLLCIQQEHQELKQGFI